MNNNKTKTRSVVQKCVWSLSTLGAVTGIAIATLAISPANTQATQNLQFDVFLDANTLAQNYVRHWRSKFMCDEKYGDIQTRLRSLTDEKRKEFLHTFNN